MYCRIVLQALLTAVFVSESVKQCVLVTLMAWLNSKNVEKRSINATH